MSSGFFIISTSTLILKIFDKYVIFSPSNDNQYYLNISIGNLYNGSPSKITINDVLMYISNDSPKSSSENGIFSVGFDSCAYSPDFNNVNIYIPIANLSNIPVREGGFYPPFDMYVYGIITSSGVGYITSQKIQFFPDNPKIPSQYIGTVTYSKISSSIS
ncbi:MAG: hypothetical protein QW478_01220 [Candidatus Micrarchaeaceae archaeon]